MTFSTGVDTCPTHPWQMWSSGSPRNGFSGSYPFSFFPVDHDELRGARSSSPDVYVSLDREYTYDLSGDSEEAITIRPWQPRGRTVCVTRLLPQSVAIIPYTHTTILTGPNRRGGMIKMTFTLDKDAVRQLDRAAQRLSMPKSQVVREGAARIRRGDRPSFRERASEHARPIRRGSPGDPGPPA